MSIADFLSAVALPAFIGGGSAWLLLQFLGEKIIAHRLSKDIERYKSELAERTDVLKTQLAIFSHEQNVATSRVDTQRADAIHKVYACIRGVINPTSSIVAGVPIMNGTVEQSVRFYFEHAEQAHAACGELVHTLADLAIYFDDDTYKEVKLFAEAAMNAIAQYLRHLRKLEAEGGTPDELLSIAESNREALRLSQSESMHPQAKHLTSVFRGQLGIERSSSAA